MQFQKMNKLKDYETKIFQNQNPLRNQPHNHYNFEEITAEEGYFLTENGKPLLVTNIQSLNYMRKDLIESPNLLLGYTKGNKTAPNSHQIQKKKCD